MKTETLTCKSCEQSFEREVKRGVKPSTCPACKESVARVTERAIASAIPSVQEALDLARDYVAWVREDAECWAMYQSGELTRDEWIAFKPEMPDMTDAACDAIPLVK